MFKKLWQRFRKKNEKNSTQGGNDLKKELILLIFGSMLLLNFILFILSYIPDIFHYLSFDLSAFQTPPATDATMAIKIPQQNKTCYNQTTHLKSPPPIPQFKWQGTGLITLWFDDAWLSQFTTAAIILQKEGLKGAESITLRFLCTPSFMNWEQLSNLQDRGWETVSHSVTHNCNLEYYNAQTTYLELAESQKVIRQHGLRADDFAMPCGYSLDDIRHYFIGQTPPLIETVKTQYRSYRTTNGSHINPLPIRDPYNLYALAIRNTTSEQEIQNYIEMAKVRRGWAILVFHQIDNSNRPFSVGIAQFQKIVAIVKASGLPVVLPNQALAIKQFPEESTQKKS